MPISNTWSVAAIALACAALAGCGSSGSKSGSSSSSSAASVSSATDTSSPAPAIKAVPAVAKLVPASIRSQGPLTVASDATYAPDEFFASDGKTIIGANVDILTAVAATMGMKVHFINEPFDGVIPGLQSGKYEIGSSSFTDTKAREKQVNFVDYYKAGQSFYTKRSGGTQIAGLAGTCGHTIAVEAGSIELTGLQAEAPKCKAQGKPISVLTFPDQNSVNLAVTSGRAQAAFADSTVADYEVKKFSGEFKLVGQAVAQEPCGFALPKDSKLGPAIAAGVKVIMHDGLYEKLLKKWNVQSGAIPASEVKINGATS